MTAAWRSLKQPRRSSPPRGQDRGAGRTVRAFLFRPRFDFMEDRTLLSTFLVSNTNDSGPGSLRQAILDSDAATGATNVIGFDIPGQGVQTIEPLSPLPAIISPVLIDGFSQPGYAGMPLIELNGSRSGGDDGLTITGSGVTVRGLDIDSFSQGAGIHITGTAATGNWIYGNFLGTNPTGTQAEPDDSGVEIDAGATDNLVGTNGDGIDDAAERNVISGDLFAGVWINGQGTDGNAVAGNLIGTDVTAEVALDNGASAVTTSYPYGPVDAYLTVGGGVVIEGGASANRIGTDGASVDDAGERNIIAGSDNDGIDIVGTGTDGNIVAGNFIGTDATGTRALGVSGNGVDIAENASSNWIGVNPKGGTALGDEGNLISGNGDDGIAIGTGSDGNVIAGNKVGTDVTGTLALGNLYDGVGIGGLGEGTTIGGTVAGAGNLISDNGAEGVVVGGIPAGSYSVGNQITENRIFANTGQAIDLGGEGVVTDNGTYPRQGPNNLQNFPILVTTASGQVEGWLGGSLPNTSFDIDFFASSSYNADGAGEAEDYLGSMNVTTDATGQVFFTVPFTAPAGLPILTATATDPQGNTSEVSALREPTLATPSPSLRIVPNDALVFSAASGDGFAIDDPDAGPLNPVWTLTLTVSAGTLTLSSTTGLTGSGNGTGSLSYSGRLSDVDAALAGMSYTPPAGPHVFATLSLSAQSAGATPVSSEFVISDGVFVVTTTADSGPGSLRQAILDSNAVTGATNAIDFDIPGTGVQTIIPLSPLPAIATSVEVDGTTQPGYAGTPLVAFGGPQAGSSPLAIANGDVTIRGLAIGSPAIDPTTSEDLIAIVDAQDGTSQLSLIDAQGNVLVQNDGVSSGSPESAIDEQLAAGDYSLSATGATSPGTATWTIMLQPAAVALQPIPLVGTPAAMVAGDFTGNGRLDLAVVNDDPSDVSILLGNGDGTFQPAVNYAVGYQPGYLVAGDFTGDGRLDLVVSDEDGIQILMGDGDGTFQPARTVAAGVSGPLVAGDFNGDGHLDIAVSNSGNDNVFPLINSGPGDVVILLGNGDGTFRIEQTTYAVGQEPMAIVAGDFAGDGHLDLAVADYFSNEVSILLGNGDGTFQPAVAYGVGQYPQAIAVGDFTGDGNLDLAVANAGELNSINVDTLGSVSVLLGNGDGTFRPGGQYALAHQPVAIATGDFTDNGRLDLAVTDYDNGCVSVLLGNGDGTFQPEVFCATPGVAPIGMVGGDFNGDGRTDLAVVGPGDGSGAVSILLGNGDGTFEASAGNSVGAAADDFAAGDFTGDGHLDLAVSLYQSNDIVVLLGNGDGTFQAPVDYAVGSVPEQIVTGDFNGDGRLDLAVADGESDEVSILLGNGDGTFQPAVQYAAGAGPGAMATGDFTGNGKLDLAVADRFGDDVSILLGNGDGTFQSATQYAAGSTPWAIVAGDFAGNGKLDLAVTDFGSDTVSILLGNGDGTFQPPEQYSAGTFPGAITEGDFAGNGRLDLAVADEFSGVSVLLGNGDGTFQPPVSYAAAQFNPSIIAGAFTGNGRVDLAVPDGDNSVYVLLGNGDGTFQPAVSYTVSGSAPIYVVAGDFNGSGQIDLAVANLGSDNVSMLLGNGDGTFVDASTVVTTPYANPVVADVSGDGTSAVFVVDGSGDILYRQGIPGQPGSYFPPVTVNLGNPSRDIAWVPNTLDGPLLASVDAQDDAISLYAYRDGAFVLIGSLTTGDLPAQIIAADLNGGGLDDLVVGNAGDGTLSVFFPRTFNGPVNPQADVPAFLPPVTLSVGVGVSDIQAVDTTGGGRLDLVVSNKLTGQLSVLLNLGGGAFAAPVPYRAGTGLSLIDPGTTPEITSEDATAGVAAGSFTTGGPADLVTINPGSNTLDVLVGLGGGRFASPVAIDTASPAQIVRVADFTGNGIDDLAVLTKSGVSIYLGNGDGGFLPPVTYDVPAQSSGLTVADVTGNGKLDLLVGDAYGDVLVLLGNGDGTFAPYREANQAVELAVADLTGNGSKDIIYADQGLDRVVVDYGAGNSAVLADQSTGLLEPGAVALADLNGDGIPDLIVANSGSNNVLIYPGLGNGQFGPAINDGNGYFVGTDPVGITVANLTGPLPDLVVADEGSDQVSILLNQSQVGGVISFSAGPRLNSGGSGPVSTVVGNFTGEAFPDILVTNSLSNDVALLPGVGQGFFNDTDPQIYAVGADPGPTFVGNFNGQNDLITVNAGTNDLTLISGFNGPDPVTSSISSAGLDPATAFEFSSDTGFDNLVVGNGGDGVLALFEGSSTGLTLSSTETVPGLPSPTSLAFASLSGGQVQFYAATEGQEAAALVALSLGGGEISPISALESAASSGVAQLVPLQETSLALVGTLLTLTIEPSASETEAVAALASLSAAPASLGQSALGRGNLGGLDSDGNELQAVPPDEAGARQAMPAAPAWERYMLGTDEAIERFDREHPDLFPGNNNNKPSETNPGDGSDEADVAPREGGDLRQGWLSAAADALRFKAADKAIDMLCGHDRHAVTQSWWRDEVALWAGLALAPTDPISTARTTCSALLRSLAVFSHAADQEAATRLPIHRSPDGGWALSGRGPMATEASLVLASVVAGYVCYRPAAKRARLGGRWLSGCHWDRR